jgi:hypothetical protein
MTTLSTAAKNKLATFTTLEQAIVYLTGAYASAVGASAILERVGDQPQLRADQYLWISPNSGTQFAARVTFPVAEDWEATDGPFHGKVLETIQGAFPTSFE